MDIPKKKGSRTTGFLIGSFILLILISVSAFICLGSYMSTVSKEAIDKVGDLYMLGIKEHVSSHFQTLMELKLEQAETVVKVVPADMESIDELYEELVYRVSVRNFDYLALCSEDGDMQMLNGEQLQPDDPEPFFESLKRREKKVAVGRDLSDNEVVMFGVNAEYPMKNDGKSMAIVVAIPIDYISTMLGTEEEDAVIYSYIIRKDGSFIVSNMEGEYSDYFSSLYERYSHEDKEKIETYIQELSEAMNKKEDYSAIMDFEGSRYTVRLSPIRNGIWLP